MLEARPRPPGRRGVTLRVLLLPVPLEGRGLRVAPLPSAPTVVLWVQWGRDLLTSAWLGARRDSR